METQLEVARFRRSAIATVFWEQPSRIPTGRARMKVVEVFIFWNKKTAPGSWFMLTSHVGQRAYGKATAKIELVKRCSTVCA